MGVQLFFPETNQIVSAAAGEHPLNSPAFNVPQCQLQEARGFQTLESFRQREEPRPGIRTEDPRVRVIGGHAHHLVQDSDASCPPQR